MPTDKRRIDVMVSSTTKDLGEHRRRIGEIISRFKMVPRIMDLDSTTGKDGVTYSLDLVDEAEIYILLIGFRYGHIPDDPRNPDKVSITELEYRRALEREKRGELCVLPFVMADDHPLLHDHIEIDPDKRAKLDKFRAAVMGKQLSFFSSIDDLEKKVSQSLGMSDCVQKMLHVSDSSEAQAFKPRVGETLAGRYVFEALLGKGGNGEVWRAQEHDPSGKAARTVAIKLLKPEVSENTQRIERFKHEIGLGYKLLHPNIIRMLHWGEIGGQFYAVMDYVQGDTLRDRLRGRTLTVPEAVAQLTQLAEALDYAHLRHSIVHRDVKPENILVEDGMLKLGDFGLAISPDEDMSLTESGELVGTKKYMAPELWDSQPAVSQSDIYALGIIAYEMLTGVFPFDASSHARLLTQHLHDPLPPHPNLPDEVLRVLRRATDKTPGARYARATEFVTELTHWQLDPANIDTKVRKYLDVLGFRLRGDVVSQFFVDLEGNARQIAPAKAAPQSVEGYADAYLDRLLADFAVDLDADHHVPQQAEPAHIPNILDKLASSPRIVLVGEPGSGKSFLLRRFVMRLISEFSQHGSIPVFVPLNAFKGIDLAGTPQSFDSYVQSQLGELAAYQEKLRSKLILVCDALNEMPRFAPDGRDLVKEVHATLANTERFVVSCRIRDYKNDLDGLKLERVEVRDMDLPTIQTFIQKYLRDGAADFWARIGGSEDLFVFWQQVRDKGESARFWQERAGVPSYTSWKARYAWHAMWQGAKLLPLARNPYLAQVICSLHRKQKIPDNRAELYEAFVADLYERERAQLSARGQTPAERAALEEYLTAIANRLQAERTTMLKRQTLAEEDDLLQAALDATLLVQDGDDIRFTHQLLQEYFSAKNLALQMARDEDPRPLLGDAWWLITSWRETAVMLAEFTHDAEAVARWIGRANPELGVETIQRITWDRALTSIEAATRDALIASAREKTSETNPIGRAAAYRVLGLLNADDRPGVGLRPDGLPDIDWVQIPDDGKWLYQSDQHPLLPDFYMSRYPITYDQFQAFANAWDFNNDRWWVGMPDDEEAYYGTNYPTHDLAEQSFKHGNHPRENISWYQAVAFCRWLSDKLRYEVSLPTEEQWEKAARGNDGRTYPYGNKFDLTRGNTRESGIRQTSAVGIFREGKSPYGVLDLSGNVWEWCRNKYDNSAQISIDSSGDWRVLRGGAWNDEQDLARAAYRNNYRPDNWSPNLGFRVVCEQHL